MTEKQVQNADETGQQEAGEGTTSLTRQQALNKAYSAASARLREEHRKQFDALYVEEAAKLGVEYKPKPTEEEKAEQQLRELLAQHPNLRSKIAPATAEA